MNSGSLTTCRPPRAVMNIEPAANPFRNILLLFSTIGLVMCGLAIYFYLDTRHFVDHAARADGVVTALEKGIRRQTWPTVAFKTASGAPVEFHTHVAGQPSSPRFPIGTRLDILYDERQPSDARINTILDLWGLPLALGFMGLFFLGLGCVVAVYTTRAARRLSVRGSKSKPR
jgi:hypothetical protein